MKLIIQIVYLPKTLLNELLNRFLFFRKRVECHSFPRINGRVCIKGHGRLVLGEKVMFNSSMGSNPIGGDTKLILDLGSNGILLFGDNTVKSNAAIIAHNKVHIGKNVKIGGSVKIYDTDFHSLDPIKRADTKPDVPTKKEVFIEDNAFIGAHSIILKGVLIGENAIIGAGSVVTKNVPKNEIWGGNPAKLINKINWST